MEEQKRRFRGGSNVKEAQILSMLKLADGWDFGVYTRTGKPNEIALFIICRNEEVSLFLSGLLKGLCPVSVPPKEEGTFLLQFHPYLDLHGRLNMLSRSGLITYDFGGDEANASEFGIYLEG